ncbi:hypothetical protein [Streptacidiphilus melanogenes]|uniref:hypothetical protein n=1 Tax=Streptacidiphilus melanogenes TaxID=411235 RepID=UPI0006942073|nr:hypothetical protein [Streptacidiphilus melanogenes]
MFRGRRVPDELLPVLMVWTWAGARAERVRARAREVHSTRDLGALSFELVALAIGLIAVAGALIVVLTKVVKTKANTIH